MNRLLILDDDPLALYCTLGALRQRDYLIAAAAGIEQAESWLAEWPIDLIVSSVRIGTVSGLSFVAAARVGNPELAAILIGSEGDEPLEEDAARNGASLLIRPYDAEHLLMIVAETLASIRHRQRWPRKRVRQPLAVRVGATTARLIDVSYGGLRFAVPDGGAALRSTMTIGFPGAQAPIRAELVWSAIEGDGATCQCGAAVLDEAPLAGWRQFVDAIPPES